MSAPTKTTPRARLLALRQRGTALSRQPRAGRTPTRLAALGASFRSARIVKAARLSFMERGIPREGTTKHMCFGARSTRAGLA